MLIIGWFIIRRDLRPLESMTTTAERISEGDLSQRVGVPDDGSEVGRLGHAFDTMLDQIQGAFDSQHAALVAKERSELQLRRFVADASHELRTPLTAVRGYSELYRAGGLADRGGHGTGNDAHRQREPAHGGTRRGHAAARAAGPGPPAAPRRGAAQRARQRRAARPARGRA